MQSGHAGGGTRSRPYRGIRRKTSSSTTLQLHGSAQRNERG